MIEEQAATTAILAALNTALALNTTLAPRVAYDFGGVPSPRPDDYVEVSVTWRYVEGARHDAYVPTDGARILTRYVSRKVENARLMRSKVVERLRHGAVPLGGGEIAYTTRETAEPIGDDDGWFSGYDTWTFTA